MQMSKEIKKYLKEIKLLLPAFSKEEKKFLRDLLERIEDYLDENPNATMQDIEKQFGTPMEMVKSSFVCKFNSCIIVLLNLSTMLRAQIAALWQFALALLLCQFPLIF